ncbi:uncharacterized protein UBRO_01950 [Ustilago bromivora]|uniref:Mig1 protein n=1 Tax=Ustilago bromivora TaxID=307758 RepID=A0A1K0H956_9BASI|nr:uncharacterized protein UBRO_01950 [Ustilago bromivora]
MHARLILTSLLNLLVLTPLAMSANSAPALFDSSPKGQGEWKRFCSPSSATSATELPPFACFTIYDDITTSAHSGTHQKLGYASASGQDFVVVSPKRGEDSKVEFSVSGFWFQILFSDSTRCAKAAVWAPVRAATRSKKEGEETALEPFMRGVSCRTGQGEEPQIFRITI